MFYFNLKKTPVHSISVVYSTTCIPFHLFAVSVPTFGPFSPSSSSVWQAGVGSCTVPTSTPRRKADLSTAPLQGSSERAPTPQASLRTRKDVVSYESSALPRTMKTTQRQFCEGSLRGLSISLWRIHMDPFKINLLWGISEQGKLGCPPLSGTWCNALSWGTLLQHLL